MDLNSRQSEILRHLAPQLEKVKVKTKIWMGFLVLLLLFGGYALLRQVIDGHGVTGMRDHVVWGLYISNFIYFIGISYTAAILAAVFYFFQISWSRPIIRISSLIALISGIIGPIFILLCVGRFDRMHYLFVHARIQSPITWDVMVISTYIVGITIFVYLLNIKDFAVLRDTKLIDLPDWQKKLYRFLALGYNTNNGQDIQLDQSTKTMAFIMVPKVILAFSVLGWIFGMTLRPGWHSTIFGPSFVVSSGATGVGLTIALMWFYRRKYSLEKYITERQFLYMGYLMLFLVAIYGYFVFSEFVTNWYVSSKWNTMVMAKKINFSEYGWWNLFTNFFAVILPILVISISKWRKPNIIAGAAFLMVLAMWVKKYLVVVPTLETPLIPMQDTRMEYIHYTPTWTEWALTASGVATFLLFFVIITRFVTVVSLAEYAHRRNAESEVILKNIES